MEWVIIVSLLIVGLALLIIEILFVPGTTLGGILGVASLVFGGVLGFQYFGNTIGWVISICTTLVSGVVIYLSFTSTLWKRFALTDVLKSKVNENRKIELKEGLEGITTSNLRPIGNAEFIGQIVEVKTVGEYLPAGIKIKIKKIIENQIVVEPLN